MTIKKVAEKILQSDRAEVLQQGAAEKRRTQKVSRMVDLAHEAIVKRAAQDCNNLEALVRMGWPYVKREKFKSKIRKKVWDIVSEDTGNANTVLVDEVTDKILDVSEADEYYMNMFNKDEA